MIKYSVIIPIKDEAENIQPVIEELEAVMAQIQEPWELLCINDGSTDQSGELLKQLAETRPHLHIISFEHNYGQSSAFDAGFRLCRGTFAITLDADGQNDPQDIPKMLKALEDHDLVCGWRVNRRDTWVKRQTSRIANMVRSRICGDAMHDSGCSLKIYRTACFAKIKLFHGMHRFLPALFKIEGFRVTEIPVNHRERRKGKSKYHFFNRGLGPIVDLWAVYWMRRRRLRYSVKTPQ